MVILIALKLEIKTKLDQLILGPVPVRLSKIFEFFLGPV